MSAPGRDPRPDSPARLPAVIEDEAADWVARRDKGFSTQEAIDFERWVAADPRHRAALARLEEAWTLLNAPRAAGRSSSLMSVMNGLKRKAHRRRRRTFISVGATLAAAAALVLGARFGAGLVWRTMSPAAPTVVLRPDRQALPDGSLVELNAGAEIEVDFSPRVRGIRLLRGEALFSVAKDPARPFVVSAGTVAVRAVGTVFSVRFDVTKVDVLVAEGKVALEKSAEARRSSGAVTAAATHLISTPIDEPILSAGQRVAIDIEVAVAGAPKAVPAPVAKLSESEVTEALAWRHRRVEFTSTELAEAVPLFNQSGGRQLVLADAATGNLRISGVFWTDDPEAFARLLESSLGIIARHTGDDRILLRR